MPLQSGFYRRADQHHMTDAGTKCLLNGVLDQWFVNNRQQLFGDGLGGWQKAGAETGNRKNDSGDHNDSIQFLFARIVPSGWPKPKPISPEKMHVLT